jgi:hypothetical protein
MFSDGATVTVAMAKRPTTTKQSTHSWAVYHLKGTPAQFIGIIFNQPNPESAIKVAIQEYKIPANLHDRLLARRRD